MEKIVRSLMLFFIRLHTRVSEISEEQAGLVRRQYGGVTFYFPTESFILDNGQRAVKVVIHYKPYWEGEWDKKDTP